MGAYQNNPDGKKKGKGGRRGSVKNSARLDAFAEQVSKGDADWGGCPSDVLQSVVVTITSMGGAVTLGLSRDEGACMLTLLLDKKRQTLWFNGDADLGEEMSKVLGILEAMPQ